MVNYYDELSIPRPFSRDGLDHVKPVIACDFDGVLNPINKHRVYVGSDTYSVLSEVFPKAGDWAIKKQEIDPTIFFAPDNEETVSWSETRKIQIQWSSELVNEINKLIDSDKVTFLWLTSWRHRAEQILAPVLGLHSKPNHWVEFSDSTRNDFQPGKEDALRQLYNAVDNPQYFVNRFEKRKQAGRILSENLASEEASKQIVLDRWEAHKNTPKYSKLVWLDDAATHYVENFKHPDNPRAVQFIEELNVQDMLAVAPKMAGGISRVQWKAVLDFLS
jgi:hypothetical protein